LYYYSGVDLVRQGWNRKGPNVLQEGYGSAAVLPEEGIYLAASIYRPVLQVLLLGLLYPSKVLTMFNKYVLFLT
jgi:exocyst complex component 4